MPRSITQYLDLSLVLLFAAGLLHGIVSLGTAAGDAWATPEAAAPAAASAPAWSVGVGQVATMFFVVGYPLALIVAVSAPWARRYGFLSLVCLLLATGRTQAVLGTGLEDPLLGAFHGVALALLEVASLAFLTAALGSPGATKLAALAAPFHAAQELIPMGTGVFAGAGFLLVAAAFAVAINARLQGAGQVAPLAKPVRVN